MRVLVIFLLLGILAAIGATGGGAYLLYTYGRDLPDYRELENYEPDIVSRLHAGDGRLLAEYGVEQRIFVPYASIPPVVVQAFVAAEDQRFWDHPGFDPIGIARAVITNVRNVMDDRRLVGASTITQQVAKNFFFSNEVSIRRKVKELILAFRIERTFSKERILELYLNEIYLGNRSYGVAAAALNYFNKSLEELSIAEAAYLAALPKAPNNYQPQRNYEAAIARRNYVIGRMAEDGYIEPEMADIASDMPLLTRRRDQAEVVEAPYFAEEIRRRLTERYGADSLLRDGLSVRTTLDPRLQKIAQDAFIDGIVAYDRRHGWRGPVRRLTNFDNWPDQLAAIRTPPGDRDWRLAVVFRTDGREAQIGLSDGSFGTIPFETMRWARPALDDGGVGAAPQKITDVLAEGDVVLVEPILAEGDTDSDEPETTRSFALQQSPKVQGALVAMDPFTGRVLAMVGGSAYSGSEFNRATQALRQPGSSFKPFVYLAALQNGFTPSSLVVDGPIAIDQGPFLPKWRPSNYTNRFYGPTPLRVGLEKSRNLMTVRLAQSIGMEAIAETVEAFGVMEDPPTVISSVLGAVETTLLDITTAYARLANGGQAIDPTLIDRVQDRQGRTLYQHDARRCAGCVDVAWAGGDDPRPPAIPRDRRQLADPRHVYQVVAMLEGVVERGTGRQLRALDRPLAGKTGTTNDYRDAWFIGFSPDLVVGVYVGFDDNSGLGPDESGGRAALPIFQNFMAEALKDEPAIPFRVPPGLRMVRVNAETGKLADAGARNTIWEGFIPGTEPGTDDLILDNEGSFLQAGSYRGPALDSGAGADVGTGGLY